MIFLYSHIQILVSKTINKMDIKDGQYYYARLRRAYAIYLKHESPDGHWSSDKIDDNLSAKEAKRRVYVLNGWSNG
jgi:hypothetical protein